MDGATGGSRRCPARSVSFIPKKVQFVSVINTSSFIWFEQTLIPAAALRRRPSTWVALDGCGGEPEEGRARYGRGWSDVQSVPFIVIRDSEGDKTATPRESEKAVSSAHRRRRDPRLIDGGGYRQRCWSQARWPLVLIEAAELRTLRLPRSSLFLYHSIHSIPLLPLPPSSLPLPRISFLSD